METAIEVGQIWRAKDGNERYEVVGIAADESTVVALLDGGGRKDLPFICRNTTIRRSGTLVLPDIDWRTTVAEGQAGEAVVCLMCGGAKPGRVFTCEPCGNLEGTAKMALEWQRVVTAKRMAKYAANDAMNKKYRAERETEDAIMVAAGFCMNCLRMPTVPPGMTVAVKDERGYCWNCHLSREKRIADDRDDAESDTPSALMPVENPLVLQPYDNRVAGIGAFGGIWRMR